MTTGHRTRTTAAVMGAALALAGCHPSDGPTKAERNAAAAHYVPPPTQGPAPLPGQAHAETLAAYVGHYANEPIDGVLFFDRTEVATALDAAVRDPKLRRLFISTDGVMTPIFRRGTGYAAHACRPHDCADHNWTLVVPAAGGTAQACYHDAETMKGTSHWYANGTPVTRPGECPSA